MPISAISYNFLSLEWLIPNVPNIRLLLCAVNVAV